MQWSNIILSVIGKTIITFSSFTYKMLQCSLTIIYIMLIFTIDTILYYKYFSTGHFLLLLF